MKSFRGARNSQMIRHDEKFARLVMDFYAEKREQTAAMSITSDARDVSINKVPQTAASALMGKLCFVVFSPDRMSLITGGASERRRFVDAAISQAYPRFANILSDFNKAIAQRNALVKRSVSVQQLRADVSIWDMTIAAAGAEIAKRRAEFIGSLSEIAQRIYAGISAEREQMRLRYNCSFCEIPTEEGAQLSKGDIMKQYLDRLAESVETDFNVRFTTKGPQRDDLEVTLDGRDIRSYGSQGQKRSAVLSLKLAEAEMLARLIGEQPIALLDDVMSELDASRQEYLLNRLDGWQVMITCCDPAPLRLMDKGAVWMMDKGRLSREE